MSTWMHISGCIRFDGIPGLTPGCDEAGVRELMGQTVDFDDDDPKWDLCTVPCGSEGSLQYEVIRAGDGLVLFTVPVWGDLRDYDDVEEVTNWFDRITSNPGNFSIRQAVLEIEVEDRPAIVLRYGEECRCAVWLLTGIKRAKEIDNDQQ